MGFSFLSFLCLSVLSVDQLTWSHYDALIWYLADKALSLKGNPVKIRNGPAAVTGEERDKAEGAKPSAATGSHGFPGRRRNLLILKSEDLPENSTPKIVLADRTWSIAAPGAGALPILWDCAVGIKK